MSDKKVSRQRRAKRVRMKIREQGVTRLCINRTPRHIYAQVIAAEGDRVLATASTLEIDTESKSNFTFFPNPVNNVLTIKAQASIDSITVYNMLGQTVVRSTPNTNDSTVDMSLLQSGAYFVQVSINNTLKTVRVIKN